jgi:hypothetical protein
MNFILAETTHYLKIKYWKINGTEVKRQIQGFQKPRNYSIIWFISLLHASQ